MTAALIENAMKTLAIVRPVSLGDGDQAANIAASRSALPHVKNPLGTAKAVLCISGAITAINDAPIHALPLVTPPPGIVTAAKMVIMVTNAT